MKIPFTIQLKDKVIVITGAGGVLCSTFARAVAACGAKVALLDLNLEAAERVAKEIASEGGTAKAFQANVLDKENLELVRQQVTTSLGSCDMLINGAGGNNPRATTDKEYFEPGDETLEAIKTFLTSTRMGLNLSFPSTTSAPSCPARCLRGI